MHTIDKKVIFLGCCTLLLLFTSCLVSTASPVSRTVKYEAEIAPFGRIDKDLQIPSWDPFHLYLNFFLSPGTITADLTGEIVFDQEKKTITMRGQDGNFRTDGGIQFTGSMEIDFVIPARFFEDLFGLSTIQFLKLIFQFDDFHLNGKIPLFQYGKAWRENTDFNSLLLSGESVQVRAGIPDILSKKLTVEDLAGVIVTGLTGIPPAAVDVAKIVIQKGLGSSGISLNAGLTSDLTLSCKALSANGKQITQETQSIAAPGLDLSQGNYWVNSKYIGDLGSKLDLLFSADYEFMFNPLGILIWEYDEPFAELPINIIPQQHTDLSFNTSPAAIPFPIVDQAPAAQPPEAVTGNLHTVRLAENGASWSVNMAPYFSSANALRYRVTPQNTSIARASPTGWRSGSLFTIQPRNAGSTTVVITAEDPTSGLTATQTIAVTVEAPPPDYTDISQPISGIGEQPKESLRRDTNVVLILNTEPRVRNIRDNPGFNSNVVGQMADRATGVITDGPVTLGGHTWYEVEWDDLPRWNNQGWISAYRSGTQVLVHNPPDLEIYDFDVDDNTVKPDERLTLEADIKNNGPGDSKPTKIFFYYSTERHDAFSRPDPPDPLDKRKFLADSILQRKIKYADIDGSVAVDVPSIRQGRRKTIKITVNAPLTPHTDYYYGAIVTPEPVAVNLTQALNNFTTQDRPRRAEEEAVEVTSDPDFIVLSISSNKAILDPGETFELEATVKNRGLGTPLRNGKLNYYRSSNETIRDNDTKVGSDTISKLDTGETGDEWIRLTAPTTPGVYYYGACVDLRYERETGNNCSSAVAITVRDLSPQRGPDPSDLIVEPFSVSATTLTPAEPFTLNATVRNQGNGRADATTLRYYRSSNTRISFSDTEVGSSDISSLNAGNADQRSISLTAPIASGTYYYGACVEGVDTESDTRNNCSVGVAITVENLPTVPTDSPPPATTLLVDGVSVTIDLHPYFSDPNGDDIMYQASTADPNIVAVELFDGSESFLTINPLGEEGITTVVVEAKDAQSSSWTARQDITVTITAPSLTPPSLITSVCDRTPQIRDALTHISRVADCADVTSVHLDALTTLALAAEGITALKVDDFDGLANLTALNLSENRLTALDTSALYPLVNLRQMDVSRNQLIFLDENTFSAHPELTALDLSNNRLAYVPPGAFSALAGLTKLNLAGNQFTELPLGIFAGLSSLTELDVRDNPGGPFTLSPIPVRTDTLDRSAVGPATVAVYVAQGAPFDMDVSLTAEGGILSETTVVIASGDTYSQSITVTPTGTGAVTVASSVSGVPLAYYGLQISPGNPLVLFDVGANQAPTVAAPIPAQTLRTGGASGTLDLSSYFSDVDNDPLTYTVTSSNQNVATVSVSAAILTITPQFTGSAIVTITASDGFLTTTRTFVTIVTGNQSPVVVGTVPTQTLIAGAPAATIDISNYFSDPDGDVLTYTATSHDPAVATVIPSTIAGIAITPKNPGTVILSVTASDGISTVTQTFIVTVVPALPVSIPDPNLVTVVRETLGLGANDTITQANILGLTRLDAQHRSITNLIGLEYATNLTSLSLFRNNVSDVTPLAALTNLTELLLTNNQVRDVTPLSVLINLTYLDLYGNQINDVAPLAALTNLTGLDLTSAQVSDLTPLAALTNLTYLNLYGNGISEVSPLAALTNLTYLHLGGNQISDISLLKDLTNLKELSLYSNEISDISTLAALTNLTLLGLDHNQIAAIPTGFFKGFSNLNTLTLTGNPGAPFTFTLELARIDTTDLTVSGPASVVVRVAEGAPFDMSVTLSVSGGLLSTTTAMIAKGSTESSPIIVMPIGVEATTVSLRTPPQIPAGHSDADHYEGIQMAVGGPLVLFGDAPTNRAPVAVGTIPTQTLSLGVPTVEIDVSGYFSDPDGTALTYTANSNDTAIATVSAAGTTATLTPVGVGSTTITVVASDGNLTATQTFTVTVNATWMPDANLRAAVRAALGLNEGETLIPQKLQGLTTLDAYILGISNITGLEYAKGLNYLNLHTNQISDITPLQNLNALKSVYLDSNQISDLTPLQNLNLLDNLSLYNNQISDITSLEDLTALTWLELGTNQISDITPLDGLTALQNLQISNNQIKDISSLDGLTALTALGLVNNQISDITPVQELTALTELLLSGNQISDVSALEDLIALRTLLLSGNPITDYAPLRRLKEKNPNVYIDIDITTDPNNDPVAVGTIPAQTLTAGGSAATVVVSSYFSDPDGDTLTYTANSNNTAVATVSTSGNTVTITPIGVGAATITVTASDGTSTATQTFTVTINADINVCARTPQIRDAIVAAAGVTDCSSVTAQHLRSITRLEVKSKGITTLKDGDFSGLNNLTHLDLIGNQLTSLDANIFSGLSNLQYLFLRSNRLSSLDVNVFSGLNNLDVVLLDSNELTSLNANIFSGLSQLTQLTLNNNQLTSLDANIFSGLSNLTLLTLRNNRLTALDANIFSGLNKLTRLILGGNQLTSLGTNIFNGLNQLQFLDLERNQLASLNANTFSGLSGLTELWLGQNKLTSLPSSIFSGLSSLRQLVLGDNQLTSLPTGVFSGLSSLQDLFLAFNQLRSLPDGVFSGLNSLKDVRLSNNPGAPFTLTLELDRTDNTDPTAASPATVKVKVAEGAPFDMRVTLSVSGGTLSATAATIAKGSTESSAITVTQTGTGTTTVSLGAAPTVPFSSPFAGIQTAVGDPLVLFSTQNRSPVAQGTIPAQTLTAGGSATTVNVSSYFSDPDADALTYKASSNNTAVVTVSTLGSTVSITPVAVGSATITVTASDGALTATQTFTATVNAANRAPAAVGTIPAQTLTAGGTAATVNVSSNFSDPDGDTLTYTATSSDTTVASVSVTSVTLTITPKTAGTATITVTASDGSLTATQTLTATVNAANRAPVAVGTIPAQTLTVGGSAATVNVSSKFSDPDGDTLTYTASSNDTAVATVSTAGATVTITPVAAGSATITATASDGSLTATQTFTATVTAANRAPVAVGTIPAQTLTVGGTATTVTVSSYFSDPDSDTLTYTASSNTTSVATVSISDTQVSITPVAAGNATIIVTANDGSLTTTQTIAVTVAVPASISIPDVNLAAAVRSALGLGANDAITQANILGLTNLDAQAKNIANLTGLEHAKNLTKLVFQQNNISGVAPLKDLTKLTYLDLHHNNISDVAPLKDLTKLTYLGLVNNNVSDVTPLKDLTKLTYLGISYNNISDVTPLKDLTKLTWLSLHFNNNISDVTPLKDLTKLTNLYLESNNISNATSLKDLTELTVLTLNNNNISDVTPLKDLTKLDELRLISNQISDISALAALTNLTVLDLNDNQITALPTGFFTGLPNLTTLGLRLNPGTPFTLKLELARTDTTDLNAQGPATVKIKVAEGTPFAMSVSLSVTGGTLSTTTATIVKGSTESGAITVTQSGAGATTVTLGTAPTIPSGYYGIQTAVGNPIVLFSAGAAPAVVTAEQPNTTALLSNFPNPFNPETWIPYQLATPADVTVTIYTMRGVLVRRLELGHQPVGFYQGRSRAAYWDGRNVYGESVASGLYFYTLTAGEFTATRRMFILK